MAGDGSKHRECAAGATAKRSDADSGSSGSSRSNASACVVLLERLRQALLRSSPRLGHERVRTLLLCGDGHRGSGGGIAAVVVEHCRHEGADVLLLGSRRRSLVDRLLHPLETSVGRFCREHLPERTQVVAVPHPDL